MSTKVQIIFPPQFEPFQPYLSLPYLKGLLKIYEIDSKYYDSNVDFYWWLIREYKKEHWPDSPQKEYLWENIDEAIQTLYMVPQSYFKYRWAISVADEFLEALSPQDIKISLTSLTIGNKYSSKDLYQYLNSSENVFNEFFEYAINKILGLDETVYYFFSLVVLDQLGAALTFARQIKSIKPQAKIAFGGPMVSRFYKRLVAIPWVKNIVDFIIPGEAYKTLPRIFKYEKMYTGHVTPDYGDLELDKYFAPKIVLPYLVAHGCKWGLCRFCSHHLTYSEYRASNSEQVVRDISNLVKKYGVEYISFSDEYLTADQLNNLVDLFQKHAVNVYWSSFVRAEPQFSNKDFVRKLYDGGARLLMFGFESASQKVLNEMRKGTHVNSYVPILKACKKANVAVRLDFMVGFPGESQNDVRQTYAFIRNNSKLIDTPFSSFAIAIFELREDTPIIHELMKKRVKILSLLRGNLDEQYSFILSKGLSSKQKQWWRHKIIKYFKNELNAELFTPRNKTHQLLFKDLYDRNQIKTAFVKKVNNKNICNLKASWNNGVVIITDHSNSALRITNYATGGELMVSLELSDVIESFKAIGSLASVRSRFSNCDSSAFIKLINFLHRNDYLLIGYSKKGLRQTGLLNTRKVPLSL